MSLLICISEHFRKVMHDLRLFWWACSRISGSCSYKTWKLTCIYIVLWLSKLCSYCEKSCFNNFCPLKFMSKSFWLLSILVALSLLWHLTGLYIWHTGNCVGHLSYTSNYQWLWVETRLAGYDFFPWHSRLAVLCRSPLWREWFVNCRGSIVLVYPPVYATAENMADIKVSRESAKAVAVAQSTQSQWPWRNIDPFP